jgi:hydroxymethylpyrimidine pyrophosphatase-like HAD family hydrolase
VKPLADLRLEHPVQVLYADLDGTLVGPGGSLYAAIPEGSTARGAAAVAALHEAGVQLVLMSGRTRRQMQETARILGAAAYVAELGAFLVERGDPDVVVPNLGAFDRWSEAAGPFAAMARSGAGAFLLDRYAGRLEPHTPWAFEGREATMLLRGHLDLDEATDALARAGYTWLDLRDNGIIRRKIVGLDVDEIHAYHLVPRGVSKASAVALHRRRHELPAAATAAIGDSPSDLEVAGEVGHVFLVANAAERPAGDDPGNAYRTAGAGGEGVAEVVEALLRSR